VKANAAAVLADVSVVQTALALPALEPLNGARAAKVGALSRGCLRAAAAAASAAVALNAAKAKDDDLEPAMVALVERALEVADAAASALAASKHTDNNTLLNVDTACAATLLHALWHQVSASYEHRAAEKGKSPSRGGGASGRVNLQKVQQGFSVLSVALAGHALRLCARILDDLDDDEGGEADGDEGEAFDFERPALRRTAAARVAALLAAAPLLQLLHLLGIVAYRKAYTLKKALKPNAADDDTVSFSDSTIYNGDDFSFSEDSSEDDDSEPILG